MSGWVWSLRGYIQSDEWTISSTVTDQSHEIALSKASWFHRVLAIDASLLLLAVMSFVTQLGVSVMLPLLPLYAITLGATPIQQGLLTSGFALASALGQLVAGAFLDRWGARRFIRAGIAIYAAANVLIANALDAVFLIVFRTTAGLGSGANLIGTRVYIAQTANPARLAFVNGVLSAASSAGQVGGPAIGGLIAAVSDLRMPFLLVGFTSGLAFIGSLFLRAAPIKPWTQRSRSPTRNAGTLTGPISTSW